MPIGWAYPFLCLLKNWFELQPDWFGCRDRYWLCWWVKMMDLPPHRMSCHAVSGQPIVHGYHSRTGELAQRLESEDEASYPHLFSWPYFMRPPAITPWVIWIWSWLRKCLLIILTSVMTQACVFNISFVPTSILLLYQVHCMFRDVHSYHGFPFLPPDLFSIEHFF